MTWRCATALWDTLETFIPNGASFAFGNMILAEVVPEYDQARRRQEKYQLGRMLGVLRVRNVRAPIGAPPACTRLSGVGVFVGYLVLDALIGNSDRHHDNWGVIVPREAGIYTYHLAPTFDHASSLGREQTTQAIARRLSTTDRRGDVEAYASRCRSAFYRPGPVPKTLTSGQVLSALVNTYRNSTQFWAQKAVNLSDEWLEDMLKRIDPSFVSTDAIHFALRMLRFNKRQLSEVALG